MGGVFICYRRSDTRGTAGRLYDVLIDRFGTLLVYRDIDANELGVDYVGAIADWIRECDALIVIIGDQWSESRDKLGNRRLDDPEDLVRSEIVTALEAGKVVIPVLVEDAVMPSGKDLPEPLAPLTSRMALSISDLRWQSDVDRLISRLQGLLSDASTPTSASDQDGHRAMRRGAALVLAAIMLAVGFLALYVIVLDDDPTTKHSTGGVVPTDYNGRVLEVCVKKAQNEARIKSRSEEVNRNFQSTLDMAALHSDLFRLSLEGLNDNINLKGTVNALQPPPDLAAIHKKVLDAWDRHIDAERSFVDDHRKAVAKGPAESAQFLQSYDLSRLRETDDQINESLIQLVRGGCRPTA